MTDSTLRHNANTGAFLDDYMNEEADGPDKLTSMGIVVNTHESREALEVDLAMTLLTLVLTAALAGARSFLIGGKQSR